jgi:glycosyltransferase involved in cell wall biosynthesis
MTKLSILMPLFNGELYLDEQITSIINQSFSDWKLLIVDDGSTDDSVDIARRFSSLDPRITFVKSRNLGNVGQKARILELFYLQDSDFISISDQDDIWHPSKLSVLLENIGTSDICFGSSRLIADDGHDLGQDLLNNFRPLFQNGDRLSLLFRPVVSAHSMIARNKLFQGASLNSLLPFDWLMSLEAAFGNGITFAPESRTWHRMHANNQMNGSNTKPSPKEKMFSRYDFRNIQRETWKNRYKFLGFIEFILTSRCTTVYYRDLFRSVHHLCLMNWFNCSLQERISGSALISEISDILKPASGSYEEWNYVIQKLSLICRDPYDAGRILERVRRVRSQD